MTWIVTDRKYNAIYIDLNSKDGKALYLAPGQKPRMVGKEESVLHASPHILPFEYKPSLSEAEGFTRLKALLMDTIPAEDHQRYFVICWLISIFLMDYFRDRGILQLVGGSCVGKSNVLNRASMLIYGQSLLGRATWDAMERLWTSNPLVFIDNVENRNLVPRTVDPMLLCTSAARVGKLEDGEHKELKKINALCMATSIEPFPEKYPELINRTFPVEFKQKFKQLAFLNDETMKMIVQYRSQMLSDIFRLISLKVLPYIDTIDSLGLVRNKHIGHAKERLNDHIEVMVLILEALLEHLPIQDTPSKLQAVAIVNQWVADWNGEDQCKGVDLGDGNFSGCTGTGGDCPGCGE